MAEPITNQKTSGTIQPTSRTSKEKGHQDFSLLN